MDHRDIATPLLLIVLLTVGVWAARHMLAPENVMEMVRLFSFCGDLFSARGGISTSAAKPPIYVRATR